MERGKEAKKGYYFLRAAETGDVKVIKDEIAKGSDVDVRDDGKNTALHLASYRGHWEVVSALLHAGADPSHGNENQDQPLHLAALANSLDVLRVLMATGTAWQSKVTIEAADAQGYAALHYAAEACRYLVCECKASLESRNRDGLTPLMCAVQQGHAPIVQALVDVSPRNVHETNNCGDTALHYATISRNGLAMLRILLRAGADPLHANAEGCTALQEVEKQEACAALLEHISSALAAARVSPHDHAGRQRVVDAVLAAPPPPSARRGAAADKALLSQSADKARIDGVPPGGAFAHAGSGAAGVPGAGRRVRSKFSSARAGMRVKTAVEVAREELERGSAAGGAAAKPKPKSRIFSAGSTPAFNF